MTIEIFNNERGKIFVSKMKQYLYFRKDNSNMYFVYDLKNEIFYKVKTYKTKEDIKEQVDIGKYTQWFYLCSFVVDDDKFAKMILFTAHSYDYMNTYRSNIRLIQRLSSKNTQRFEEWYGYGFIIKEVEDFFDSVQNNGQLKNSYGFYSRYHHINFKYSPHEANKDTLKILKKYQDENGFITLNIIDDIISYYNNGEYQIVEELEKEADKVENRDIFTINRYYGEEYIFEDKNYLSSRTVRMLVDMIKDFNLDMNAFLKWLRMQKNVEKNSLYFIIDHYYDYLKMQLGIHDNKYSKINKYPKNFRTVEHQTVVEYEAIKEEIDAKEFEESSRKFRELEYKGNQYQIMIPTNPKMIDAEASAQSNCLRSYKSTMQQGKTCICFMRKREHLDEPLISIEVRDKSVVQAYGEHNRYVTDSEKDFIYDWAKAKGLACSFAYSDA